MITRILVGLAAMAVGVFVYITRELEREMLSEGDWWS